MHKDFGTKSIKFSIINVYNRDIMSGPEGIFDQIVSSFYYEAYPGHTWTRVNIADGGTLTLTDEFEQLQADTRAYILDQLFTFREFRAQTNGRQHLGEVLNSGKEGTVFTLGDNYVIKVMIPNAHAQDEDYHIRMLNMALLRKMVAQSHDFPEWVEVVENYLCLIDLDETKYTVMPRIGNGVTMDDLLGHALNLGQKSNRIEASIKRNFPRFSIEKFESLVDQLSYIIRVFDTKLIIGFPAAQSLPYLDDLGLNNVIVTPVDESVIGYPYKLWVIDQ